MKTSPLGFPLFLGAIALVLAACSSSSSSTPAASTTPAPTTPPIAGTPTMAASFPAAAPQPANPATSDIATTPPPGPQPLATTVGAIDFDQQVKPFFANYCIQCHGPKRQANRVRFDTQIGLRGQLSPGNPTASHMYRAMTSNMPPEGMDKPTAAEIAVIKQWITEGAKISDSYPMGTPPPAPTPRPTPLQQ